MYKQQKNDCKQTIRVAVCRRCNLLTQLPDTITAMEKEESATKTINNERRRSKRQRENGSQTDDEIFQDGAATRWQKEVNQKLDYLLTIVPQ